MIVVFSFFSSVLLPNYSDNRAAAFFDIAFIAVGTYIFMNIFTAIMYSQFRGYLLVRVTTKDFLFAHSPAYIKNGLLPVFLQSSVQKRIFRRRVAVRAAFEVLKSRDV